MSAICSFVPFPEFEQRKKELRAAVADILRSSKNKSNASTLLLAAREEARRGALRDAWLLLHKRIRVSGGVYLPWVDIDVADISEGKGSNECFTIHTKRLEPDGSFFHLGITFDMTIYAERAFVTTE